MSLCEAKDWQRMYDLIFNGKDGAGVAKSITTATKAAARYIAGCKLLGETIDDIDNTTFSAFGKRAIQLGMDDSSLKKYYDEETVPESLLLQVRELLHIKSTGCIPRKIITKLIKAGVLVDVETPDRDTTNLYLYKNTYDERSFSITPTDRFNERFNILSTSNVENSPEPWTVLNDEDLFKVIIESIHDMPEYDALK